MAKRSILPKFQLAVVADGVRHEVEPSPLAMVEWERFHEQPVFQLLSVKSTTEQLLRLVWFELKVSGDREGGLPAFDDWVATITEIEGLGNDDDDAAE